MEIAIISDTHMPRGSRRVPDECVARLRASELIVHAGDLMTMAGLNELRALGPEVIAVHGNVDDANVRRALPRRAEFECSGARIGVIHDAGPRRGRLARMRAAFPGADAVIFGHSHLPLHEQDEDGFQIFNPGSPTERRRAPAHTMGIAHVHERCPRRDQRSTREEPASEWNVKGHERAQSSARATHRTERNKVRAVEFELVQLV